MTEAMRGLLGNLTSCICICICIIMYIYIYTVYIYTYIYIICSYSYLVSAYYTFRYTSYKTIKYVYAYTNTLPHHTRPDTTGPDPTLPCIPHHTLRDHIAHHTSHITHHTHTHTIRKHTHTDIYIYVYVHTHIQVYIHWVYIYIHTLAQELQFCFVLFKVFGLGWHQSSLCYVLNLSIPIWDCFDHPESHKADLGVADLCLSWKKCYMVHKEIPMDRIWARADLGSFKSLLGHCVCLRGEIRNHHLSVGWSFQWVQRTSWADHGSHTSQLWGLLIIRIWEYMGSLMCWEFTIQKTTIQQLCMSLLPSNCREIWNVGAFQSKPPAFCIRRSGGFTFDPALVRISGSTVPEDMVPAVVSAKMLLESGLCEN